MKQFDLSAYNLQTKIYWLLMLVLSAAALGFAAYGLFSFSLEQFAVLAVALVIAALVNQHQFKIPRTRLNISARKILIFWGVIWLGVPGAVLLAAVSSLAKYKLSIRDKNHWLLGVFANVVSSLFAAEVLYLAVKYVFGFEQAASAAAGGGAIGKSVGFQTLLPAAALMVAAHYVSVSVLNAIFLKLECDYPILSLWKESYLYTLASYAAGCFAAVVLHYTFLQFGLGFGLVLLPIAVFGHIAFRIHAKRLAQKTREITEASRIHLATVEALATAIDARGQVGLGHVRRTQIYAAGIGEVLNLSNDEIQALHTGALLHDIGKLAVPDHILNKAGKLTPAEMEKMKIHSTVGASILEKVEFPYPVVPTVKHHHELWDGSGYPDGLRREEIPLTARILAVADAYDSMRSSRPYRRAVSREEARKILLSGAGAQFDPKVVDTFLRNLRKFEAQIRAQGLSYDLEAGGEEEDAGSLEAATAASEVSTGYVAQIKQANREVFALYELARVFGTSLNLEETLSLFGKKIGELVPFDTCVVYLFDKSQEFASAAYAEGRNAEQLKNKRVKPGEGATGYVLSKQAPIHNVNPGLDFSFYQLEFMQDYTAMISLPLVTEEKLLLGAVSLYSCDLENYEDEHLRLLETVSRIASDAISKSLTHAETETRALTDPMTGLPNARCLQSQFEKEVARARRNGCEFQVLMLDLDGFKKVNDTFGHKTGDMLLKEISKVMRGQLRDYDFLARYAGDEFVAIIPETSGRDIQDLCDRLEKAVLGFALPVGDGRFARVGVSLGAACYPQHGESLDQVIIAADKAMYSVKAQHKQKQQPPPPPAAAKPQQEVPFVGQALPTAPLVKPPVLAAVAAEEEEPFIVELDESHIISSAVN